MAEMITYQAVHTVHLGQLKTEISAGETFQFDGETVVVKGEKHTLPSIKVAIQQGWFRPVAQTSTSTTVTKTPSKSSKVPVVADQVSTSPDFSQNSSAPSMQKDARVRGVNQVETQTASGFKKNVVVSDDDSTRQSNKTFTSGIVATKAPEGGSSQEGNVVSTVFKTSTSRKLKIGSDEDLSREAAALEKETSPVSRTKGQVDTRESQTVRSAGGRVETQASTSQMDTLDEDGSFMTQTSEGVTMKVQGAFNRSKMKVVSMDSTGFLNENGEDSKVVNTVRTPAVISAGDKLTQKAVNAAESGKVVDVTTPDLKPFNWDMTKHWKTRVREAAQYKTNPQVFNQILSMETPTVVRHLTESK